MIDIETVIKQADLLAICGQYVELKKVATTGGGEYAGACPFCGGKDRFRVQPYAQPRPVWFCRNCTGALWDTVIGFIAKRDYLDTHKRADLEEICKRAIGGEVPTTATRIKPIPKPPQAADKPPGDDWQAAARQVVAACGVYLWTPGGAKALEYLHWRGLTDETIKRARLGFVPGVSYENIAGLGVPPGILIPCEVGGRLWYLKSRIPKELIKKEVDPWPKYKSVTGSKLKAIYNGDALRGDKALFCEGEFDCLLANQELGQDIPAVTLGAAGNIPDVATWGGYLLPLKIALIAYDLDNAGDKGSQAVYNLLGHRSKLALLPAGDWKDITDYYKAGGNLGDWINQYIDYEPEPIFTNDL